MKQRWTTILATTAALALASVASAQGRGRPGGGGSSPSRGGGSPSRSGGFPSRTGGSPSRTTPPRSDPFGRSRSDRTPSSHSPWSGRTSRGGSGTSGSWGDRRNPFDRSGGRFGGSYGDRSPFGGSSRGYRGAPSRYDGRGNARPTWYGNGLGRASLSEQIRRTGARTGYNASFGGTYGGLRVGYVSYGGYRRSGFSLGFGFGYPYYAYDPFLANAVVATSPWYRYSYLPPYIDNTRVIVVQDRDSSWDTDGWQTYDRDRRDEAVQGALDDLRDAFEDNNDRDASRLVPDSGEIAIYNDGKYDYSLNSDDFRQMFLDGVEQSQTTKYEIIDVRKRDDEVRVRARHSFEDSWGEQRSVTHTLTLRRDRGGDYVIREFGTE